MKFSDFGLAVPATADTVFHGVWMKGSEDFVAPEIVLDNTLFTASADLWAIGATIKYLLGAKLPIVGPRVEDVTVSPLMQKLLDGLLVKPKHRWSFQRFYAFVDEFCVDAAAMVGTSSLNP